MKNVHTSSICSWGLGLCKIAIIVIMLRSTTAFSYFVTIGKNNAIRSLSSSLSSTSIPANTSLAAFVRLPVAPSSSSSARQAAAITSTSTTRGISSTTSEKTEITTTTTQASAQTSAQTSASAPATPALGNPFHYAFPVHSLDAAKNFYGNVLGCEEGRSSEKWQDYSLYGHQIVCHWVGNDYKCIDYYNPVDGDEVPVPHAGIALQSVEQFNSLVDKLRSHQFQFIIEPHLRFQGQPGEQYTMFFKDPSGNNLEFKAMTNQENLFAKYNV